MTPFHSKERESWEECISELNRIGFKSPQYEQTLWHWVKEHDLRLLQEVEDRLSDMVPNPNKRLSWKDGIQTAKQTLTDLRKDLE